MRAAAAAAAAGGAMTGQVMRVAHAEDVFDNDRNKFVGARQLRVAGDGKKEIRILHILIQTSLSLSPFFFQNIFILIFS